MFDSINKPNITFEKYLDMKSKLMVKNHTEKFKWIDKSLYIFSWFGNCASIFLAFFFLQSLFQSSFKGVSNTVVVTFGIILFLTLFELLKRYIFGLFSVEFIKLKFKLFKKQMLFYVISSLLLVSGSFYLSLSGAKDFIDNQKIFEKETKTLVSSKKDSITSVYEKKKNDYIVEIGKLKEIGRAHV